MRWLTYRHDGAERAGILDEDNNVRGFPPGLTMLDLLRSPGGLPARAADVTAGPGHVAAIGDVTVCAPLQPPSIRDCLGFLQHLRNCAAPAGLTIDHRYEQIPAFYFTNPGSILGPNDDVAIFPGSRQFDFELEVCAVIGKPGRDIPRERASGHIAGYAIFCDWSARDLQVSELPMGCGPAKSKDGATTLGPLLVTADEIEPHRAGKGFALSMTAAVNGEQISQGRWDSIDWDFADMIAYTSRGTELRPGDVIGSGTVPTGCLFEHYATHPGSFRGWLQPGDEVHLAVEQLGDIRQRVIAGPKPIPLSTGF
jgi:2-keto-4-pentenoate hydratase/2-oxohepta-3-ene-1,7-dioic acid hydratase in catechol pathway